MPLFSRRQTIGGITAFVATSAGAQQRKGAVAGPIGDVFAAAAETLLAAYPEAGVYHGAPAALDGGPLARGFDDYSPAGQAAARAALRAARTLLARTKVRGDGVDAEQRAAAAAMLDGALRSADVPYGRISPFSMSGHLPYVINPIETPLIKGLDVMTDYQSLGSVRAVDAWIEKLGTVGAACDAMITTMRSDVASGCRTPAVLLQGALPPVDALLTGAADRSRLIITFVARMEAAGLSRRIRQTALRRAIVALTRNARPGLARLRAEIAATIPLGAASAGIWAQPEGEALYDANVRALGDTSLSPDSIHALGLAESARISAVINDRLIAIGMTKGSIADRMVALANDPTQLFPDTPAGREAMLASIRQTIAAAETQYDDILPADLRQRRPLDVKPVLAEAQASAPGALYESASIDGMRTGTYWINLRDMAAVPRFRLPTLSHHEGVPGHHTQASIALLRPSVPLLLAMANFNAHAEGWAVYAEKLMADRGAYRDDPLGALGWLQDELFRAVRLVVDTGLHHKRWTREAAIDHLHNTTGIAISRSTAEIERYMAWPGQALGYKLGELRLLGLRDRFLVRKQRDIRAFHAAVLSGGALPLDLVEKRLGL